MGSLGPGQDSQLMEELQRVAGESEELRKKSISLSCHPGRAGQGPGKGPQHRSSAGQRRIELKKDEFRIIRYTKALHLPSNGS